MRKLICLLLASLLPLPGNAAVPAEQLPEIHALSAAVMSEDGELLYEREADRMLPIASTTKLMTALVVIENCALDETVDILPNTAGRRARPCISNRGSDIRFVSCCWACCLPQGTTLRLRWPVTARGILNHSLSE